MTLAASHGTSPLAAALPALPAKLPALPADIGWVLAGTPAALRGVAAVPAAESGAQSRLPGMQLAACPAPALRPGTPEPVPVLLQAISVTALTNVTLRTICST